MRAAFGPATTASVASPVPMPAFAEEALPGESTPRGECGGPTLASARAPPNPLSGALVCVRWRAICGVRERARVQSHFECVDVVLSRCARRRALRDAKGNAH